jgi:hypothetical protein
MRSVCHTRPACHTTLRSWAACILYKIAQVEGGFSPESWVGRNADAFAGKPVNIKYLLALYFSISTFTGVGWRRAAAAAHGGAAGAQAGAAVVAARGLGCAAQQCGAALQDWATATSTPAPLRRLAS